MAGDAIRAPVASAPVLAAQRLGRRYGRNTVLANVDLAVYPGEVVGLLGADGAGKTTLMQMFAAILDPSEGRCSVLGFDTVRQSAAVTARIGYMSQGFSLYDRLSVEENLAFAARIRGVGAADYRRRRGELMEMSGLGPFAERRAGALSGGMRKKLSLCSNLIHEPPVLILDEPSLGVDPASRRDLWRLLGEARDAGTAIILTTPYMDEAGRCDRVAFLAGGRVLASGTPEDLAGRVAGRVFRLQADDIGAAGRRLAGLTDIKAVQWLPDGLRFQLAGDADAAAVRASVSRLGRLEPVEAGIEDAFVALTDAGERPAAAVPTVGAPERAATGNAVSAAGVTVRFGRFTAVSAVSVEIAPGEVVGWLGPNGAGKTTLIRVLCGLLRPTAGSAVIAGAEVRRDPFAVRRRIGYMSQQFSLYPDLTVGENLRFYASAYGLGGARRHAAIHDVAARTGIAGFEAQRCRDLSGALRQRLALACAIMHRPSVLFLDEPTSGVDPIARQRFWALIQSLAAEGVAVMVTTHYLEEARYCHRLGLMHRGRLLGMGSAAALAGELGLAGDASMDAIFMGYLERTAS